MTSLKGGLPPDDMEATRGLWRRSPAMDNGAGSPTNIGENFECVCLCLFKVFFFMSMLFLLYFVLCGSLCSGFSGYQVLTNAIGTLAFIRFTGAVVEKVC